MFQKFDIRYKYDITFYQIKKKGRVDPAEMTRGRVDSGAEMETGRVDPPPSVSTFKSESELLSGESEGIEISLPILKPVLSTETSMSLVLLFKLID